MKKAINQIIKNEKNFIIYLIGFSFLIRLIVLYFLNNDEIDHTYYFGISNEWGVLLNNLIQHNTFARYGSGDSLVPSLMLPPLYAYFLYFIKILTPAKINFLYTVIFIQIIISTISIFIFFNLNKQFFLERTSLINTTIFSLLPLNIYAAGQSSSITIQIFLSLSFLLFLFILIKSQTKKNILIFSLISGLLILARAEFILIYALTILYLFLRKKVNITYLVAISFLTLLVVSPYLIRNYVVFNKIVFVKTLGYNLWKGNNEFSSVEGYENQRHKSFKNLENKLEELKLDTFYEINRDGIYLNEALKNLKEKPLKYLKLSFQKAFSFYFIDFKSSYPNYYKFYHFLPILLIAIISLPGLILILFNNEFKNSYLKNYLLITIGIFSIFSILPRYKLMILPIQIILAAYFIQYLLRKIKKNAS